MQIVADILAITSRGAKKTWIMYQANLSYRLLCRYLDEVLDAGLVEFEDGNSYLLTGKGREFLSKHEEYSKRCKSLEEHLNHVNSEKSALEKMCLNSSRVNNDSNRVDRNKESRK